jgi:hypothetical protein
MENGAQQSRRESPHGASLVSNVLFVTVDTGVVCDGAFMFKVRCTGGVFCHQWSE